MHGNFNRSTIGRPTGVPHLNDRLVVLKPQKGLLLIGGPAGPNSLRDPYLRVAEFSEAADNA